MLLLISRISLVIDLAMFTVFEYKRLKGDSAQITDVFIVFEGIFFAIYMSMFLLGHF